MKISEILRENQHEWLTKPNEMWAWLNKYTNLYSDDIIGWQDPNGITILSSFDLLPNTGWDGTFKVKIKEVKRILEICNGNFDSFETFPSLVGDFLMLCPSNISSLKNVPVCQSLEVKKCKITSIDEIFPYLRTPMHSVNVADLEIKTLVGISKLIRTRISHLALPLEIESGGIELLNVPKLESLDLDMLNDDDYKHLPALKAYRIIEKYLGQPGKIFDCQTELIDNGLDKFAEM